MYFFVFQFLNSVVSFSWIFNYRRIDWIFYTLNLNFLLGTRRSINDSFSFGFILVLCIVIVCFQCITLVFNSYCTRNNFGYSASLREYYIKFSKDHWKSFSTCFWNVIYFTFKFKFKAFILQKTVLSIRYLFCPTLTCV